MLPLFLGYRERRYRPGEDSVAQFFLRELAVSASYQELLPSVWDRLLACGSPDADPYFDFGVPELLRLVQRDLEELLNTWQTYRGLCEDLPEAASSVVAYGIPDLPSQSTYTFAQREELAQAITLAIQKFEPRLKDIKTVIRPEGSAKIQTLGIHISGQLVLGKLESIPWKGAWRLGLNQRLFRTDET